jgi:hypothetical protein
MLAYKVYRNNERLCIAGVGPSGVLTACISWVGRRSETLPGVAADGASREQPSELSFHVGGLISDAPERASHMRWVDVDLQAGDEIRIQIVEAQQVDAPTTEHHEDPINNRVAKGNYVRQLAKELGWIIRES